MISTLSWRLPLIKEVDIWLHAGDFGDDARYMQEHTDIPGYAVRGNNDRVQPLEPREQLIPLEGYLYLHDTWSCGYHNIIDTKID